MKRYENNTRIPKLSGMQLPPSFREGSEERKNVCKTPSWPLNYISQRLHQMQYSANSSFSVIFTINTAQSTFPLQTLHTAQDCAVYAFIQVYYKYIFVQD